MSNKKLLHVTMYYYPIRGGQEVYIDNLNKFVLSEYDIDILQPNNRYTDYFPSNVHRTFQLPLLNRVFHDFHWFFFNFNLLFKRVFFKNYQIIIVHYPFHNNYVHASKKIIVSHGVDWRLSKSSHSDRFRKHSALRLYKDKGVGIIVANDTNFLTSIGCNAKNVEPFTEIEKDIWFIPNCIDISTFNQDLNVYKEKIFLCPRNIRWERGIHLAIDSFHEFIKKSEDNTYKLLILGGPLKGAYYNLCMELVGKYGLDDRVTFYGSVSNDVIMEYYRKSMITIIPTIEQEGTSLSALESMACGTPVVSTSNGGLVDLPTLKAESNATDLADKLLLMLRDYERIKSEQFNQTRDIFNMTNWSNAWRKVINNAYKAS